MGLPAAQTLDHWLVRGRPQLVRERRKRPLPWREEGRIDRVLRSMVHKMATRWCSRHRTPWAEGTRRRPTSCRVGPICVPSRRISSSRPRSAIYPREYRAAECDLPAGAPAGVRGGVPHAQRGAPALHGGLRDAPTRPWLVPGADAGARCQADWVDAGYVARFRAPV